jgi:HKD family nuclease
MSNRFKVLVSTPLTPLSKRMKDRTEFARSLWIATGFTSRAAVDEIAEDALRKGTTVRFITGTFGSQTRRKTFSKLLRLSQKTPFEVRIWSCARHRNFHAKLYIWRLKSGGGVAWIGSSNFTDGGLRNEGEVVAEIQGPWDGSVLREFRRAFESEWRRGEPISEHFVRTYKESKLRAPDMKAMRRRPTKELRPPGSRFFVVGINMHYREDGEVARRVDRLLEIDTPWCRVFGRVFKRVRKKDRGLFLDAVDHTLTVGQVVETARDGTAKVIAYEPLPRGNGWIKWNRVSREALSQEADFELGTKIPRSRWLSPLAGQSITRVVLALSRRRTRHRKRKKT